MTLAQWRDLAIIVYAVFWTIAGVVLLVLAIQLYKRATYFLEVAREVGEVVGTVAGISAIIRDLIKSLRGNGKGKEEG